jgi:hypothetical protein
VTQITSRGGKRRARHHIRFVLRVTAPLAAAGDNVVMKTAVELYKVIRALPDGQDVAVGAFEDVREARRIIQTLSEYWPGDYRILQPGSQDRKFELPTVRG